MNPVDISKLDKELDDLKVLNKKLLEMEKLKKENEEIFTRLHKNSNESVKVTTSTSTNSISSPEIESKHSSRKRSLSPNYRVPKKLSHKSNLCVKLESPGPSHRTSSKSSCPKGVYQAPDKINDIKHIFVSNVDKETTEDELANFISSTFDIPYSEIKCQAWISDKTDVQCITYISFKVYVPPSFYKFVLNSPKWFDNKMTVREFQYRSHQSNVRTMSLKNN